jgi:hypothetical protein
MMFAFELNFHNFQKQRVYIDLIACYNIVIIRIDIF